MNQARCRFCRQPLAHIFVDLGMSPLSNAYLKTEHLPGMEPFYPLRAFVCEKCFLVQLEEFETPERIFGEYAYFSSYSDLWLKHASDYTNMITDRLGLNSDSLVVEIASNDGYLLQYFAGKGIPVLGIEPAANCGKVAQEKGIPTLIEFFGLEMAKRLINEGKQANLIIGNNVLAHVPDLNNFVAGLGIVLRPNGTITMEFPHLLKLMEGNQFDTIYHEHFSYFSFTTVEGIFAAHSLFVFDVEELSTHGGSLRIYASHKNDKSKWRNQRVEDLILREEEYGMNRLSTYKGFSEKVKRTKRDLLEFLIKAKNQGKKIVGYGAPAKGNTLLNYCGIRADFLDYTVDRSPHKQGLFLPGTHIPIYAPDKIRETMPDYVLILPWNLKDEIMEQMSDIRQWNAKFIIPIPRVSVL